MSNFKRQSQYLHNKEKWKSLYESGMSYTQIGQQEGVYYTTVQNVLKGVVTPRPKQTYASFVDKWVELYGKGQTTTDISIQYKVDVGTVSKYLKKAGVEIRKKSGRKSPFENVIPDWIVKYKEGLSLKEIADQYQTFPQTVHKHIKDKVDMREYTETSRVYALLHPDYFDFINTNDKAYWLGVWYGTGFISKSIGGYESTLSVGIKDIDTLVRFQQCIGYERPIDIFEDEGVNVAKLRIHSKQIYESLLSHGLIQQKTENLTFPTWLPSDLVGGFLLGYYEGKGSCYLSGGIIKGKRYSSYKLSIFGNQLFLDKLNISIFNHTGIRMNQSYVKSSKKGSTPIPCLRLGSQENIMKIANWIYKDVSQYSKDRDIRQLLNN
jgi:hypothetical protein